MDSILSRQRQDDCSDGNSSPNRSTTASPSRPFTHANLDGALGDEPLSPPTTPQPMSKRHQKVSATFTLLTQQFSLSREPTFLAMLNQIQSRLEELHDGKDEEYRQQIAILEDERDRQLLAVEAARGFALERIEREYEEEKRLAEKEYQVPFPPPKLYKPRVHWLTVNLDWEEERKRRIITNIVKTLRTSPRRPHPTEPSPRCSNPHQPRLGPARASNHSHQPPRLVLPEPPHPWLQALRSQPRRGHGGLWLTRPKSNASRETGTEGGCRDLWGSRDVGER